MRGRILAVDDEPDWLDTFRQWLEPEGYELRGVGTAEDALALAGSWSPHVLLVDQKLEGPGGRDLGVSLIGRLVDRLPTGRVVLVTAFASPRAVEQAFRAGASDYMEKTRLLEALLCAKLPDLVAASAQAKGIEDQEALEAELRESWRRATTLTNSQAKGAALEETIKRLFTSVKGFSHARTNVANDTEEIDVLVTNRSTDPLLQRQGDFIVVECKNWSTSVGTPVTSRLLSKLHKRYGRSRLGVCVSMSGFTSAVRDDLLAERKGDALVLLVDAAGVEEWIEAEDRADWLVDRIQRAVVEP